MTEVADRFVVVLDANVLYPFRIRDVLLRFAEAGLFRARWSEQILNEWSASLLTTKPHLEASIRSQCDAMAHAFPEAMIEGHDALIPALDLPDPDDRHVLAAAIRAGAQHIVTANLKDFPAEALAPYGVEAVSPDAFLAATYELYPRQATATLRRMRRAYHKPPMSANELLLDLMRVGLPQLAALVRQEIEML
jgi:predicted nucleic acid-binding protein